MRFAQIALLFLTCCTISACGSQIVEFPVDGASLADGGGDGSADAAGNPGADAVADAVADAGTDAAADAGTDAIADAGTDAVADAGTDAIADAGTDVVADAGPDTALDVQDIGQDIAQDAAQDIAKDIAQDIAGLDVADGKDVAQLLPKGPAPVLLGTAGNFAIISKSAISSVPASKVTGDIGVSPAAATYITGFSLVADSTNVFATSPQIVGKAYAANYAVPTPTNLTTAVSNMETAYTDAASRPTPEFLELGSGNIGGKTLAPGLYKWTSSITIPTDVVLSGGADDTWILQTTGDLALTANKKVTLSGGARAKNVFWQVAGKTTFGAGAHFEGILLCKTEVTLQTGATMNGRILAQTLVALQQASVSQPAQ